MVKMKKVVSFALAALMLASVVSLTSCKSSNSASATQTLTVGVDTSYPPMEFTPTNGSSYAGFDIEMANDIGKKLGMKVKLVSINWTGIFNGLNAKKFDCIISSVSITSDREKTLIFTKPYLKNAQVIVTRKGYNKIKATADLKGANVGCQAQTTAQLSLDTLVKKHGYKFNMTTYDGMDQCLLALKIKKIDVVVCDEVVGDYYVKEHSDVYQKVGTKLTNEPIGVCFRKTDKSLRNKVQTALDALKSDGTLKKISEKWFGMDLASNIDTTFKALN